jgi:hypothetical protein
MQNWGIGRGEDALSRADPLTQLFYPFVGPGQIKGPPEGVGDHLPQGGREEKEDVT